MPQLNVNDTINLLTRVTPRRAWNIARVVTSFYASRWTGRARHWGYPVSVSIEPTTSCNLRCPECPSGLRAFTRPTGMLQQNFFRNAIDQLHKDLLYLVFYFQGEPYLNPEFLEMVQYASSKGIYTATSTNAHYLNDVNAQKTVESGLDRLIISIDGTTQDTYEQYRVGGQLSKVIDGAKRVVAWRKKLRSKKPFVIFQYLVVKPNEHQVNEVRALAKSIGVDEVRFKTAQVYDYVNDPNGLIPTASRFSRYRKNSSGQYESKNRLLNHCWRLWHASVITWDGLVVPCCFDKDATHRLGDLKQSSFREIWNNKRYRDFRENVLRSRKNIDICANCSEGVNVWSD